jgi:hypothetical protein
MAVANSELNDLPQGQFALKNFTVENLRPLRVVVIGAGFSGILAAIRSVASQTSTMVGSRSS